MMKKLTGVILASGEGSRMSELTEKMGLPKHLFPLGGEAVIARLALIYWPRFQKVGLIFLVKPLRKQTVR